MDITLLHSAQVEASRAIVEALGLDAGTVDSTVTADGHTVRVVGKHALAVTVCPNFSAYPAIVVKDEDAARVKSPVEDWAECLAFIDAPAEASAQAGTADAPVFIAKKDFADRFTDAERHAILLATRNGDLVLEDANNYLQYYVPENPGVNLRDPKLRAWAAYLVDTVHILTQDRANAILATP